MRCMIQGLMEMGLLTPKVMSGLPEVKLELVLGIYAQAIIQIQHVDYSYVLLSRITINTSQLTM